MTETKNTPTFRERVLLAQSELKAPKDQYNSFGKYQYRSAEDILESAKPVNRKWGLLLTLSDQIEMIGDRYYIKATAVLSDAESDQEIVCTAYARESLTKKGMDDSQITGTASSFARKYALNGLYLVDNTKDADTDEYQRQQLLASGQSEAKTYKCDKCGSKIEEFKGVPAYVVAQKTKEQYGQALCGSCASQEQKHKHDDGKAEAKDGLNA